MSALTEQRVREIVREELAKQTFDAIAAKRWARDHLRQLAQLEGEGRSDA